jgi:hypothetical protein
MIHGCVMQVRGYFVHMLGRLSQNQECSAARTLELVGEHAITSACWWPSAGTIRILRLSRPTLMPRRGWTSLRQTEAPAGHTSHEEYGRERGTDGHAVRPRCSGQLVQPGAGASVMACGRMQMTRMFLGASSAARTREKTSLPALDTECPKCCRQPIALTCAVSADRPAETMSLATASTGARRRPVRKSLALSDAKARATHRRSRLQRRRSPQSRPSASSLDPFLYVNLCLALVVRVAASELATNQSPGEVSSFHSARPTHIDRALRAMLLGKIDH